MGDDIERSLTTFSLFLGTRWIREFSQPPKVVSSSSSSSWSLLGDNAGERWGRTSENEINLNLLFGCHRFGQQHIHSQFKLATTSSWDGCGDILWEAKRSGIGFCWIFLAPRRSSRRTVAFIYDLIYEDCPVWPAEWATREQPNSIL